MRPNVFALALAAAAATAACGTSHAAEQEAAALTGGDPARGRAAIRAYGCGSCHHIKGVGGAEGTVGPPLEGIGGRSFIGGVLPNTPDNMVRWIQDPRRVDSLTAMPTLGVPESDARDIAAYLYSVK
ncbi:MAG TPA: c-type cytochrome [Gemmatimonadaceae bacterium]|nr:c-type cytochrome [Gemmatimonadaceae bacterium]